MSKIGKREVAIPAGVEVKLQGSTLNVKGKLGELQVAIPAGINVNVGDAEIVYTPKNDNAGAFWGLVRSLTDNAVTGVSEGFKKALKIEGVGFRAQMKGSTLVMALGFSHDVEYTALEGVKIQCTSQTDIVVSGYDKQKVGQVAAEIRSYKKPEPYKGKGIRYVGDHAEYVRRKEGKKK